MTRFASEIVFWNSSHCVNKNRLGNPDRPHDVDLDAAAVIRGLLDRWDGRGGGRPEIAQGGGHDADPDDVTELARRLLSQALE